MSSSPPETFTVRAGSAADAAIVAEILNAEDRSFGRPGDWDVAALDWWSQGESSWIAEEDGRPVAFGVLLHRGESVDAFVAVAPEARGRGIATDLLDRAEARARALDARALLSVACAENDRGNELLRSRGYAPVRRFYRMARELDTQPPEPSWPEGLVPRPFAREHAREFNDALNEAFLDEWRYTPMSFEEWLARRVDAPDATTDLWTGAWDGRELAAALRCDANHFGGAWIAMVGVRRRWRRRGLGLALLQHTFRLLYERGAPRVRLGVDAQNPTGATRLYERAGMQVEYADVFFRKELR